MKDYHATFSVFLYLQGYCWLESKFFSCWRSVRALWSVLLLFFIFLSASLWAYLHHKQTQKHTAYIKLRRWLTKQKPPSCKQLVLNGCMKLHCSLKHLKEKSTARRHQHQSGLFVYNQESESKGIWRHAKIHTLICDVKCRSPGPVTDEDVDGRSASILGTASWLAACCWVGWTKAVAWVTLGWETEVGVVLAGVELVECTDAPALSSAAERNGRLETQIQLHHRNQTAGKCFPLSARLGSQ